jgi:uncharacterized membrane protein YebE (DUF533 family)
MLLSLNNEFKSKNPKENGNRRKHKIQVIYDSDIYNLLLIHTCIAAIRRDGDITKRRMRNQQILMN